MSKHDDEDVLWYVIRPSELWSHYKYIATLYRTRESARVGAKLGEINSARTDTLWGARRAVKRMAKNFRAREKESRDIIESGAI